MLHRLKLVPLSIHLYFYCVRLHLFITVVSTTALTYTIIRLAADRLLQIMHVSTSNSCRYSIFLLQVSDIVYLAQVAMYKTQWSITSVILEILPKSIPISYIIQCTVNNILDVIIYSNLIRMAMFTFLLFYYIDYSFNTLTTKCKHIVH